MSKIKAVIFDMDGVLIDAKEWHYEALNRALNLFGHEINRFDHLHTFDGLPTRTKLELLSTERGLSRRLHGFLNKMKQKYTMELALTKCGPTFKHQYAISKLKEDGYKLGVASNSIKNSVDVMIERAQLSQYFDIMLSNEDVSKPKPDPEIYNTAIGRLGITPEECMIVEDNDHGIKAARASGAYVLEVNSVDDVNHVNIRQAIAQYEGHHA